MRWNHFPWMLMICAIFQSTDQQAEWGEWSKCSVYCNIGLRKRERYDVTSIETQKQYCNLGYCSSDYTTCEQDSHCYSALQSEAYCRQGRCICGLGDGYNKYNCMAEFGNCVMRKNTVTAIGYKDPSISFRNNYPVYSCTTNDNSVFKVHIIAIYGEPGGDKLQQYHRVTIIPRGPVDKPVVLVLTSYSHTYWEIHSKVGIFKILYGGYSRLSRVFRGSGCALPETVKMASRYSTYGKGGTIRLLQDIAKDYGPITSFTGVYDLEPKDHSIRNIILEVGGDPLSASPRMNTNYNHSFASCKALSPPPYYTLPTIPTITSSTASPTAVRESLSGGSIAGIVVGSLSGVAVLICSILCCFSCSSGGGGYTFTNIENRSIVTRFRTRENYSRNTNREPENFSQLRGEDSEISRSRDNGPGNTSQPQSNGSNRAAPSAPPVSSAEPFDTELPPPAYHTLTHGIGASGDEEPPPSYESVERNISYYM